MTRSPAILVFDSGLGGLTVLADVAKARPDATLTYAADDAGFPYGDWSEPALVARVTLVMERLIARYRPDVVVIACNTASTLVLPALRARFPGTPFVGTVPAIKPAALRSLSKAISVLATPGTVARDYTRALIDTYAADCRVTLVGSQDLAAMAEGWMKGDPIADADILREIRPCFVGAGAGRTDCVVLACTHYPLLLARLEAVAPWPVAWIDPAPAIARRVDHVLVERDLPGGAHPAPLDADHHAVFTSGRLPNAGLAAALRARGLQPDLDCPVPIPKASRRR